MVPGRDRSARSLRATDTPVLVERRGTVDRRLIDALALVDVVRAPVRRHGALVRERAGGVVRPRSPP